MRVLTVFAHHGSRPYCHAVRDNFDAGLRYAGRTHDVVNLHAIDVTGDHHERLSWTLGFAIEPPRENDALMFSGSV